MEAVSMRRRTFMASVMLGASSLALACQDKPVPEPEVPPGVYIPEVKPGEDVFAWLERKAGGFDRTLYGKLLGAANPYKEGDEAAGLAAADEASRTNAHAAGQHPRGRAAGALPLRGRPLHAH